jgi:4-hydroxythreonine-4-phosphate dehydrogenase
MGDPAGIGLEIILKALARPVGPQAPPQGRDKGNPRQGRQPDPADFVVYGDPALLASRARALGLNPEPLRVEACAQVAPDLAPGRLDARAGDAAYQAVHRATLDALAGRVRAVVTAPLNKEALHAAGHAFPGHTEILATLSGGVPVRMMLANDELATVLVTIHQPLREAIASLTTAGILETVQLADRHLRRAGIAAPRIAVAGLNPHAGEGGLIGREEIDIIEPAIRQARAAGIDATGPHPPDTVFMQARRFARFDVVVAMYHDQGLIPVKYLGLDDGVNVTIGLPFVRTSPDHGTAFDIAGKGVADPRSLLAAIRMAQRLTAGVGPGLPGRDPPAAVDAAGPACSG